MTKGKTMETVKPGQFYDTHLPYAKLVGDTPYEIGLQHGKAAKDQIVKSIGIYETLYKEAQGLSWEVARKRAAKFMPLMEGEYADVLEELKGVADGSGLDVLDIMTLNCRSEISMVEIADGCTSLAQKESATGHHIIGQNWDWMPEINETCIWLEVIQPGKPKLLFLAEAGIIGKYGYNSDGLAIMLNAIPANEITFDKLPIHFSLRKAMEQSSVDAAIAYLENQGGVAASANFMMADPKRFCTIEVSPKYIVVNEPIKETGVVSHTNHIINEELDKIYPYRKKVTSSPTRYARLLELNKGTDGTVASLRARLSDTANGNNSICHYPTPGAIGIGRAITLYTIIVDVNTLIGNFTIGPPAEKPTEYELFFSE